MKICNLYKTFLSICDDLDITDVIPDMEEAESISLYAYVYEKQLNAGSTAVSPLLLMAFSKTGCSHTPGLPFEDLQFI